MEDDNKCGDILENYDNSEVFFVDDNGITHPITDFFI